MDANLNFWQATALAVIQGITEFLPISSDGHLVLARRLFGWSDDGGLVFDTILHAGSLLAICIYFWREWLFILRAYFAKPDFQFQISNLENAGGVFYRRLPWLIAAATIPVVIAGPPLKPLVESADIMRTSWITGLSMIMTALLFLLAEFRLKSSTGKPISFPNAFFIGCMQIVALLPGASRSGWTTSAGIFCGQSRTNAVRFAFLMAVPAIAGAVVFQTREIIGAPQAIPAPLIVLTGVIVSFAVSLGAIHFCIRYFRNHSLRPFAVYLMIIGVLSLFIN